MKEPTTSTPSLSESELPGSRLIDRAGVTTEADVPAQQQRRGTPLALYAVTIFFSAFLLFQIEPVIAKIVLPWFGGSAAVWTTCLLFFQTVLLLGYLYAHLAQRLTPRAQVGLHLVLLAASLLLLPVIPKSEPR